jgi:hypothetical protein
VYCCDPQWQQRAGWVCLQLVCLLHGISGAAAAAGVAGRSQPQCWHAGHGPAKHSSRQVTAAGLTCTTPTSSMSPARARTAWRCAVGGTFVALSWGASGASSSGPSSSSSESAVCSSIRHASGQLVIWVASACWVHRVPVCQSCWVKAGQVLRWQRWQCWGCVCAAANRLQPGPDWTVGCGDGQCRPPTTDGVRPDSVKAAYGHHVHDLFMDGTSWRSLLRCFSWPQLSDRHMVVVVAAAGPRCQLTGDVAETPPHVHACALRTSAFRQRWQVLHCLLLRATAISRVERS